MNLHLMHTTTGKLDHLCTAFKLPTMKSSMYAIRQLLLGLKPTFVLQEVVIAPLGAVPIGLPLLIDVQQCKVIALGHKELLSR